MIFILLVCFTGVVVSQDFCYWKRSCPYMLQATKTSYDIVRGDIRDHPKLASCQAVSMWSLHHFGTPNLVGSVAKKIKKLVEKIQTQIIEGHEAGRGRLCAQDLEVFSNWQYDVENPEGPEALTYDGLMEMYNIGARVRERYRHLLDGGADDYLLRTINTPRFVASSLAYKIGLTTNTKLDFEVYIPKPDDGLLSPWENCARYDQMKEFPLYKENLQAYLRSRKFTDIQKAIQVRLGITYQLTADDIVTLYEMCTYYRRKTQKKKDIWCSPFLDEDLMVLEYREDIYQYYRCGYGTWLSPVLASPALNDLRTRFEAAVRGEGMKVVSYFASFALTERLVTALGMFRDPTVLRGADRDPDRLWRVSFLGACASNIMVVLNKCESANTTYRVQFFLNEKRMAVCPLAGCTWEEFKSKLEPFKDDRSFCSLDYPVPEFKLPIGKHVEPNVEQQQTTLASNLTSPHLLLVLASALNAIWSHLL